MTKKTILALCSLLLVLSGAFIFYFFNQDKTNFKEEEVASLVVSIKTAPELESSQGVGVNNVDIKKKELEEEILEYKKWIENYISNPDYENSDYPLYDLATLNKMADGGDVLAMKTLWLRFTKEPNTQQDTETKRHVMAARAIIYGDREMLKYMPDYIITSRVYEDENSSSEEKYRAMIDYLAVAEFAGLRGDLVTKFSQQSQFLKIQGIKLNEKDKENIRARADEIYNAYEQERIKFGLGPFDNSIPYGVRRKFEKEMIEHQITP